jgi:hypothetical protein
VEGTLRMSNFKILSWSKRLGKPTFSSPALETKAVGEVQILRAATARDRLIF